jgi:hypothetical protein
MTNSVVLYLDMIGPSLVVYTPLEAGGVGRGADMSLTGFHPLWDKILSQILQTVADQGCHLEGSSPYKGTAYRGVYCMAE